MAKAQKRYTFSHFSLSVLKKRWKTKSVMFTRKYCSITFTRNYFHLNYHYLWVYNVSTTQKLEHVVQQNKQYTGKYCSNSSFPFLGGERGGCSFQIEQQFFFFFKMSSYIKKYCKAHIFSFTIAKKTQFLHSWNNQPELYVKRKSNQLFVQLNLDVDIFLEKQINVQPLPTSRNARASDKRVKKRNAFSSCRCADVPQLTKYSSGISTRISANRILSINPVDIFTRQLKYQIFRYRNPFI